MSGLHYSIKTLEWVDHGVGSEREMVVLSTDDTPQMLYVLRRSWNEEKEEPCYLIEFSHGYIPAYLKRNYSEMVGRVTTLDAAKLVAQRHFEHYIRENYMVH